MVRNDRCFNALRALLRPAAPAAVMALLLTGSAAAQLASITVPPSGGNQRATITQGIGLVRVTIDYSSPHVHSPAGEDRHGKIWGGLVPYGMANLGFGTCGDQCPWRGGANENTLFTTTNDIKVQGQTLPAGTYGLHFLPDREEWTVIFSKNSTSWGSFFYDAKEDALRVKAKPAKSDYHEDLTYWFRDRKGDRATAVLSWEDLELPLDITVDNAKELYVENMRRELRSSAGFTWVGWNTAANYCLTAKTHLDEGLRWAEKSADATANGQVNFTTLSTLADLQEANNLAAEGKKTRARALHDPTAGPVDIHLYGRQLLALKKNAEAMEIFQLNAKLHPDAWPVNLGLARGYAALGQRKEAIERAKASLKQAPDEANRKNIQDIIQKLEQGKDI
jgi:tetratricopeptide (TPR) repeat protein